MGGGWGKYGNIAGMNTVEWSDVKNGIELWQMTVNYSQSTRLASVLISVVAFMLCVWTNMGDQQRWSKMDWNFDDHAKILLLLEG